MKPSSQMQTIAGAGVMILLTAGYPTALNALNVWHDVLACGMAPHTACYCNSNCNQASQRGATSWISPPGHDSDFVCHDGHAVQGRLPVEQSDVSIHQVPLHDVPTLELRSQLAAVPILQVPLATAFHNQVVGARPGRHTCMTCPDVSLNKGQSRLSLL